MVTVNLSELPYSTNSGRPSANGRACVAMGRDTESGQSGSCCPESVSGADSVAGGAALLARLANAAVRLFPAPSISLKGLFGAELTEGVKQAEGHSCTDSSGGGGIRNGESPRRVPSGAASLEPFDTSHQHTHTHMNIGWCGESSTI